MALLVVALLVWCERATRKTEAMFQGRWMYTDGCRWDCEQDSGYVSARSESCWLTVEGCAPLTLMIKLLVSATVMTAASLLGYSAMAPRSQLFGRTFTNNKRHGKRLALTFDDGPNDRHTPALLEVLDKHGVKATFFMIGRYVALRPEIARAVARAGHVIGNHTATHPNLIFCSDRQVRVQLVACREALESAVGEHSILFRPPYGGRRPRVLKIASELGFSTVMWSVMPYDWQLSPAWKIEANAARQIRGGDVILLHDGGLGADRTQTIAATDAIIRHYREQGFSFVTVPQMME